MRPFSSHRPSHFVSAAVAVAVTTTSPALLFADKNGEDSPYADNSGDSPYDDGMLAATELQLARQLHKDGRCREALPHFKASLAHHDGFYATLGLAECHAILQHYASAHAYYQQAEAIARARMDSAQRDGNQRRAQRARNAYLSMSQKAAEFAPKRSTLHLRQSKPQLLSDSHHISIRTIYRGVDGPLEVVAINRVTDLTRPIALDGGIYVVVISNRAGEELWRSHKVRIKAERDTMMLTIGWSAKPLQSRLRDAARGTFADDDSLPNDGETMRIAGLVLGSAGLAFAAVGAGLGFHANELHGALEQYCDAQMVCSEEGIELWEQSRTHSVAAVSLISVGAAATITGVVLYVAAPSGDHRAPQIAVSLGLGSLQLSGTW